MAAIQSIRVVLPPTLHYVRLGTVPSWSRPPVAAASEGWREGGRDQGTVQTPQSETQLSLQLGRLGHCV